MNLTDRCSVGTWSRIFDLAKFCYEHFDMIKTLYIPNIYQMMAKNQKFQYDNGNLPLKFWPKFSHPDQRSRQKWSIGSDFLKYVTFFWINTISVSSKSVDCSEWDELTWAELMATRIFPLLRMRSFAPRWFPPSNNFSEIFFCCRKPTFNFN